MLLFFFVSGCGVPKRAVQAEVVYLGLPQLEPVGISLSYVANASREVVYDGAIFYLFDQDTWFASLDADGPWDVTSSVPQEVAEIECVRLHTNNSSEGYQLCVAPLARFEQQKPTVSHRGESGIYSRAQ
jgi:hypothetical protein